jgi:predicted RNase H-like nuclease
MADVETIYTTPCREGMHQKTFSGFCHVCGTETMRDGYSVLFYETQTLQKEINSLQEEVDSLQETLEGLREEFVGLVEENAELLKVKECHDGVNHDHNHTAAS